MSLADQYYEKVLSNQPPTEEETDAAFDQSLEQDSQELSHIGPALPGNYWYSKDYEMAQRWEQTGDMRISFQRRMERLTKVYGDLLLGDSFDCERASKLVVEVESLIRKFN